MVWPACATVARQKTRHRLVQLHHPVRDVETRIGLNIGNLRLMGQVIETAVAIGGNARQRDRARLQGEVHAGVRSGRGGPCDQGKIWLRTLSRDIRWNDLNSLMNVDTLAEKFLPEMWRNPPAEAVQAGHGGGDYFEVRDFISAVRGEVPCPIGIHAAMDMTLPGLISQQSIAQGGAWLAVPDSREWVADHAER